MEGVVCCLLSPFLCFVFEVCLLINSEQPFHYHFGFAGSDAMDVFEFVHAFSDCGELRGEVLVAIKGQGGIAEGL